MTLVAAAFAAETAAMPAQQGSPFGLLLPILMVVVFYFLLIRPQSKKNKAIQKMVESLELGDEVKTIGGMMGTIKRMTDEFIALEVSDSVVINFQRTAVIGVLPKGTLKAI